MHRRFAYGYVGAFMLVAGGALGQAKPPGAPPPSAPEARIARQSATPQIALSPALVQKLASTDPEQLRSGLDEVRLAGKGAARAVPAIVAQLERGLPYTVAQAALDTLGDIEVEAASPVIAWYVRHRDLEVRRAAAKALTHTKGAIAANALRVALSDEDPMVRGTAATGLGAMKAKEAVNDLFVALDHHVNEAAGSIGQLCNPTECDALAARIGKVPFDVMTSGLDPILFRPKAEVSDDAKVKLVGRIRELGTGEANKFLRDVQKRWPAAWSPRIKQSIDQGVLATAAAPGTATGAP